jgi:D-alanine-D-alanine ligase
MSLLTVSQKIRVAVLYGGRSGEHEVSQKSAAAVIKHLDKTKFEIIPVAIDKEGHWWLNDLRHLTVDESTPIKTNHSQALFKQGGAFTEQKLDFCDVLFPVLHGSFGEDGTIQGLLEILGVPYVGANVLGSAIGMDKDVSKRLALAANIPIVPFISFNLGQWRIDRNTYQKQISEILDYPVFVKPANTGSSVGITKVKNAAALLAAIELAFHYDTKILIEKALVVREIEVAVLESLDYGAAPLVSQLGEIIPSHEFYSYEAKYLDKQGAELAIPALLPESQLEQIKNLAVQVFTNLVCEGMARVDFFIDQSSQKIYFNEINTIPGFTNISMYPKLWQVSGLSYQALLSHLLELAQLRQKRLAKLKRSL